MKSPAVYSQHTWRSIHERVALHEDNDLAGLLRAQIIPLVVWTVVYASVLGDSIWIDEVGRLKVLVSVHGGGVAVNERPVIERSSQRFPETVHT